MSARAPPPLCPPPPPTSRPPPPPAPPRRHRRYVRRRPRGLRWYVTRRASSRASARPGVGFLGYVRGSAGTQCSGGEISAALHVGRSVVSAGPWRPVLGCPPPPPGGGGLQWGAAGGGHTWPTTYRFAAQPRRGPAPSLPRRPSRGPTSFGLQFFPTLALSKAK